MVNDRSIIIDHRRWHRSFIHYLPQLKRQLAQVVSVWRLNNTHAGKTPFPPASSLAILVNNHRINVFGGFERLSNPFNLHKLRANWMACVKKSAVIPITKKLSGLDCRKGLEKSFDGGWVRLAAGLDESNMLFLSAKASSLVRISPQIHGLTTLYSEGSLPAIVRVEGVESKEIRAIYFKCDRSHPLLKKGSMFYER